MEKNVHIFKSPYPPVELPNVPYHRFLLDRMARHDQAKPALVDSVTGRTLTYGALRSGIEAFGAWLLRRGFGKGQTLAIVSNNLPEYAIVFHVSQDCPHPPHHVALVVCPRTLALMLML
jgi:long-subunit acyl-CoA synthetase (AMP-forming)